MTNSYPSGSPGVPDSSMPTGAPGFIPRRSSYASVVSGTTSGVSQPFQQPARSGAFSHLLNQHPDFSYDSTYSNVGGHSRYDNRGYDMDFTTNGGGHGRSGSWGRGGQLPSFSSAFGLLMNGHSYGGFGSGHMDQFFVPSYLKGSKYVQKLEEAHKAKLSAHKEGHSAQSSQPGSLSTSASSINLHAKMAPSHRGMTYDLIEKAPPLEDETLAHLPSKWNNQDKHGALEVLSDGQEVKFAGPKPERDRDHEAYAIRADHPMPPQCGIYYFEVTIISRKREESSIGIGFSSKTVPLSRLPGWEPESWAYHGDDGHSFCCQNSGKHYGPPFTAGDVIGCGVNFRTGSAFFTKNGDHLGTAFREIKGKLYPSVGMKKAGEHVRVNFGQSPFIFDIDGMMSASNHNFISSHFVNPHNPFSGSAASIGELALDGPSGSQTSSTITMDAGSAIANGDSEGPPAENDHQPSNGTLAENIHPPSIGTFAEIIYPPRTRTSTERSEEEIRLALDREWESGDPNPLGDLRPTAEHLVSLSHTMYRLLQRYRIFNRATPRRRRDVRSMFRERLNNERLSRILQVRDSEDGALDLFRTVRTEILYEFALNNELESVLDYPGLEIEPRSRLQSPGTIVVSADSRRETMHAMRRALRIVNPISYSTTSRGRQPEAPERVAESPTPFLDNADSPRTPSQAVVVFRPSGPNFQTCPFINIWANFREQSEKKHIRQEIDATSTAKLAPPLSETELIQSLVLQFLTHDGYVETAKAFSEEVHAEKKALSLDPSAAVNGFEAKEDEDAGHRQRIRAAVLDGDVEKALKYTNAFYPNVLKDNEHVYFRLRCRKFIEMIRQGAELHNSTSTNGTKKSNGHSGDWYDDIINQEMDVDDHPNQNNNWDRMDTEEPSGNQMEYQRLLSETLAYGQDLQAEFQNDPRREVSMALKDAFALIAYEDPINAKEVSHLLDPSGRVAVAEELNSAILLSLGKSSSAALEQLYQQTSVLLEDLREGGGPGAFVNIDDFARPKMGQ